MDLRVPVRGTPSRRFPRPRGDGPLPPSEQFIGSTVSPPTRGWTPPHRHTSSLLRGFPAHAGMDPPQDPAPAQPKGFPRPRGDGPLPDVAAPGHVEVSPPTRGWTSLSRQQGIAIRGFPAHAGMDPQEGARRREADRFPRPRGDGPGHRGSSVFQLQVSPPTRGWTLCGKDYPRSEIGFPRPRGDGPQGILKVISAESVSPPTRGWTVVLRGFVRPEQGFPAHAGMDPSVGCAESRATGFPRPRGDGPPHRLPGQAGEVVSPPTRGWTLHDFIERLRHEGFPAHAGMDPPIACQRPSSPGFPRPRGDGPPILKAAAREVRVSPPTRGWTVASCVAPTPPFGFPAHAGMDPILSSASTPIPWFPRPRGDGPLHRAD